jgi:chondroitin-sulfate-ABC endolyase/exolyase
MKPKAWLATALSCVTALGAQLPAAPGEGFEDEAVPSQFSTSAKSGLSISAGRCHGGTRALRWDWKAGDRLEIAHAEGGGLGPVDSFNGPAFAMDLHNDTPESGRLTIRFLQKGRVTGEFPWDLHDRGWSTARVLYSVIRTVPALEGYDTIEIQAPLAGAGTFHLDTVFYRTNSHFKNTSYPFDGFLNGNSFNSEVVDFTLRDLAADHLPLKQRQGGLYPSGRTFRDMRLAPPLREGEATAAELDYVNKRLAGVWDASVRQAFGKDSLEKINATQAAERLQDFRIVSDRDGLRADRAKVGEMQQLLLRIAISYADAGDQEKSRLAAAYLRVWDFLWDDGFRPGQLKSDLMAYSIKAMERVLREAGKWEDALLNYDYCTGVFGLVDLDACGHALAYANLDYLGSTAANAWRPISLFDDPLERVRFFRGYIRRFEREILQDNRCGIRIDGALFHHDFHNQSYASYQLANLVGALLQYQDTPFELSGAAYERVQLAFTRMNFYYQAGMTCPSLGGRWAGSVGNRLKEEGGMRTALTRAVDLKSPDKQCAFDAELNAIQLRLHPELAPTPKFRERGVAAAAAPQGTLVMGYSGLLAHRQRHWLVLVKGIGRYHTGAETYDLPWGDNRFGTWQGGGDMLVLNSADPLRQYGLGYVYDGWDFNKLDGATTLVLPPELLALPPLTTTRTRDSFVGGLRHFGSNGIFVQTLSSVPFLRVGSEHRARKTYFFLGDRVICLGSGIANRQKDYPTITTLTQKYFYDKARDKAVMEEAAKIPNRTCRFVTLDDPTWVNGQAVNGLTQSTVTLPVNRVNWLIDNHQTGFIVPAGQTVSYARKNQKNAYTGIQKELAAKADPDPQKKSPMHSGVIHSESRMDGDYLTAWLDHGHAPSDARYDYLMLIDTTPAKIAAAVARMAEPNTPPYAVLRQDAQAHILRDPDTGAWAYVFFQSQRVPLSDSPIVAVDASCLAMSTPGQQGELRLSVVNPDLNTNSYGESEPTAVRVTLRGCWSVTSRTGNALSVVRLNAGETTLEFVCRYGLGADVLLGRAVLKPSLPAPGSQK